MATRATPEPIMTNKRLQLPVLILAALLISALSLHAQTTKELPELASVERELKGGERG